MSVLKPITPSISSMTPEWPDENFGDKEFKIQVKALKDTYDTQCKNLGILYRGTPNAFSFGFPTPEQIARHREEEADLNRVIIFRLMKLKAEYEVRMLNASKPLKKEGGPRNRKLLSFDTETGACRFGATNHQFDLYGNPYKMLVFLYKRALNRTTNTPVKIQTLKKEAGIEIKDFERMFSALKDSLGITNKDDVFKRNSGTIWINPDKICTP